MTTLKIILGGLAGMAIGWVAAAVATLSLGSLFGLTEFEGQRSMTAFFAIGPLGGLIGLLTGLGLTWRAFKRRALP